MGLFENVYMFFLLLMGIGIGVGFLLLGYGFKGFLLGAFVTVAFGMISFTFAVIVLIVFVNIALRPINKTVNKFLIPLAIICLVIDVFKYTSKTESDESNTRYGTHLVAEDDNITFYEEPVEEMNRDNNEVNEEIDTNENKVDDTQSVQADLDIIPVLGAINTTESAREQINYLISAYLEVYTTEQALQLVHYIHPSSPFYQEQVSYMESINKQGIDIQLIDFSIISMEQVAEHRYEVSVEEHYTIDNPEKGSKDVQQNSKYTIELIDGEFYITGLEIL
ncbi:hypothetical protein MHB42_20325 [Lysinibacillus sp. FSL K6-0232]|uniref:TcaA NTF2-like domain-containing protein n=1 Tax=Lysinibacillus sp. FSL K6-0232 TaxID=2921425 RepID=UPI0030FD00DC